MNYDVNFVTGEGKDRDTGLLVYLVGQGDTGPELDEIPCLPETPLNDFEAEKKETRVFYEGDFEAKKLCLLGLGEESELEPHELADITGVLPEIASEKSLNSMTVVYPLFLELERINTSKFITLGLNLGGYEFDEYKNDDTSDDDEDDNESELETIELLLEDRRSSSTVQSGFNRAASLSKGIRLSRNLANTPANHLVPDDFADEANSLAAEYDQLEVEIWDKDSLKSDDMNLIMAVGKGSENPPRLIHLKYTPDDFEETVAIAGKGVTFDTGGISIKPSKKMGEMKFDMCGAATVFGFIRHCLEQNFPIKVHGLVPSAENMPGHRSVKPGDVVTGYAGKSVEILNTDAEGRLLLADALGYASEEIASEIDCLIDFATLTGSCITALGHHAAGLMGNDNALCETLESSGKRVDERVWQLPLWEDYSEEMESEIADVKNIGGDAGTITAGAFLREFVDEDKIDHWAHLDIAGTGWAMPELSYRPSGGTGFGVHLLDEFLRDRYNI